MIIDKQSYYDWHTYWIRLGKVTLMVTNRQRVFEEKKRIAVFGWWFKLIIRRS